MEDDQPEVTRTAYSQPRLRQRRTPPVQSPFSQEQQHPGFTPPEEEMIRVPFSQPVGSGAEGSPHAPLTDTSTEPAGEPRPRVNIAEIAGRMSNVFTGLVMLGFSGVGLLAKLRGQDRWVSTRPMLHEAEAMADPLSRILARHAPVEFASTVANDILDASEAVGAASDYVNRVLTKPIPHVPTEGTAQ